MWYEVLRDIMVILAATSLVLVSLFAALVVWRLYKLARVLQSDLKPIVESMQATADTVRDTTGFVGGRVVSPAASVVGLTVGAREVYQLLGQFYRGMRHEEKDDEDIGGS